MKLWMWLKISVSWLYSGRRYVINNFDSCESIDDLQSEWARLYSNVIKYHKKHWAARDFARIYHKRKMFLFFGGKA